MKLIDSLVEKVFPVNEPDVTGKQLYASLDTGQLFWLPTSRFPEERSRALKKLQDERPYMIRRIRLAGDEPFSKFLALKIREAFGYEWSTRGK